LSTYQDALDAVDAALTAVEEQRSNVAAGTSQATALDTDITFLQSKRDQIDDDAVNQALSALQAGKTLQQIQATTAKLNKAVASINATANVLTNVATVVSIVASLAAFILPLV
jgi:predicted oxidoreductase